MRKTIKALREMKVFGARSAPILHVKTLTWSETSVKPWDYEGSGARSAPFLAFWHSNLQKTLTAFRKMKVSGSGSCFLEGKWKSARCSFPFSSLWSMGGIDWIHPMGGGFPGGFLNPTPMEINYLVPDDRWPQLSIGTPSMPLTISPRRLRA